MSRLTKVSIDSVLYEIGSKGINSYATLSEMVNEKVSELYDGCIAWCNEDLKYYQWLSTNEIISIFGRWRELEFGSEFQVDDPTVDAGAEKYKEKIIQYIGVDDTTHGFKRGYFYESKKSNTINYVVAAVDATTAGTFYLLEDDGITYTEVILVGDGTNYDETKTYYKKQEVEVYTWGNINTFKIEVLDDTTPLVDKTYSSDYIENNFEAKVEYLTQEEYDNLEESAKTDGTEYRTSDTGIIYKNGVMFGKLVDEDFSEESENSIMNKTVTAKFAEVQEYVDGELTDNLKQYADEKINDADEVTEDKTWSSSKTKDYVETTLEDYTKSATEILQADYDSLDEETKLANNYHCTDTGRMYYKGILYGDKKPIELTYEEYKTLEEAGLVEADVDYVVHSNESGVLLSDLDTNHGDSEISTYEVIETLKSDVENLIDDTKLASTTSTFSANKIKNAVTYSFDTQSGSVKYVKFKPSVTAISVADIYGGKIEILGASKSVSNPDYKTVKVVRLSYGDWGSYDATQVPSVVHTKIGELYYYPTDEYYYLKLYNYASFTMTGLATAPEMVTSLPAEESAMTLIPESVFITKNDLAAQTANRQVKTFDNSGSSAEKWYKICSALTIGIGCNIKLTASRADSTATVQYFSAVFRDSLYRYTSSYISRERTVYASTLIAEYSAYIIADANNDIWVHVPSYGKAIIEIDTRAVAIDGTAGTPVEDYVYSSFEHQYDGKIDDASTNTTSTWSSSKIKSEITSTYLIKDIAAGGDNEKTVSFKIRKDYFASYYAKRTFLLSANVYTLGFSKPVIGLVEIFRGSADNYGGYVVNLQDSRYTGVTVTVNGDYLEVVVTFNSYESSGCMVSCSSLSNVPIA